MPIICDFHLVEERKAFSCDMITQRNIFTFRLEAHNLQE